MFTLKDIITVLLSYGIGCLATGYYLIVLLTGKDLRSTGSRSTGATNAGRLLGKTGFIITFLGDFLKGAVALWIARTLQVHDWAMLASLLAVACGHIWPAQLKFRGGKGIAVTLGALIVFDYRLILCFIVVFVIVFALSRAYVISGLIGFAVLPVITHMVHGKPAWSAGMALLALLIIYAHKQNIRALFKKKHTASAVVEGNNCNG